MFLKYKKLFDINMKVLSPNMKTTPIYKYKQK